MQTVSLLVATLALAAASKWTPAAPLDAEGTARLFDEWQAAFARPGADEPTCRYFLEAAGGDLDAATALYSSTR